MGKDDKTKNKAKGMRGKTKEAMGRATKDEDLKKQGKREQSKSDLKQAGQKAKDAFKH